MSESGTYDVAIVGAGPAGSSAAIRLALAGKRVVLIEKEKFPRHKLCGEFISPECLTHFAELGVLNSMRAAGGVEIAKTVFYARGGRSVEVPSEWFGANHKHALGLSRAEMDLQLLARAREVGVDVLEQTSVVDVLCIDGTVVGVKTRDGEFLAAVTLDATGRTRLVARRASGGDVVRKAKYVAFKTHVSGCSIADNVCEIFSYARGYGGASRIENGLHNICFIAAAADVKQLGSDPERVLREIVYTNKRAAEVLNGIEFVREWHAVAIERYGRGHVAPATGMLTIGDAAAFIDPFTGSGMLLALESAQIVAKVIMANDDRVVLAEEYERLHARAFTARLQISALLRRISVAPMIAETAVRVLRASSRIRKAVARATRPPAGAP